MAVQFARTLKDVWNAAIRDSRADLQFALGTIADVILEIFDALGADREIARQERRSVSHLLQLAHSAATVLDACQLVGSSLFSIPAEHCFHDLEIPRSRGLSSLYDFLDTNTRDVVEDRPFVYVVWNRQPEHFLYVVTGQRDEGKGRDRALKLRGKLLQSLQQGSLLTLICPSHMTASLASAVEAALLSVLDSQRAFPDFNDPVQKACYLRPSSHLDDIGELVSELGTRLQIPAHP